MRRLALHEILSPEQREEVRQILLRESDPISAKDQLLRYLIPLRAQLEAKDVLPEYLAYAIPFALQQVRESRSS